MKPVLQQTLAAVVVLVLSFIAPAPAVADPFEDGVAAYQRNDYATALRLWRPLAEQGHTDAQFNLGFMYETGGAIPSDLTGRGFGRVAGRRLGHEGRFAALAVLLLCPR